MVIKYCKNKDPRTTIAREFLVKLLIPNLKE